MAEAAAPAGAGAGKRGGSKRGRRKQPKKAAGSHVVFGSDDEDEVEVGATGGAGRAEKRAAADGAKESRRERKRRRRKERGEDVDEPAAQKDKAKPPLEKKLKYFRAKVFGVTVRSKADGEEEDDDDDAGNANANEGNAAADGAVEKPLGFDEMRGLIEDAGGKVSGILHKRVFALVASDRAVRRRSQKVRKALKYDVPVVSEAFLTACKEAKACVALEPFLREVPAAETDPVGDAKKTKKKDKKDKKGKKAKKTKTPKRAGFEIVEDDDDDSAATAAVAPVLEVDLGCCCSCHDAGKPSCEWCEKHH